MKIILLFLLILQMPNVYGQTPNWDTSKICNQIEIAINYILKDKEEHIKNINFQNVVNDGRGYFFLDREYIACKLGIELKKMDYTSEKTNELYKKLYAASFKTFNLNLDCIKNRKRKMNTYLSKIDNETIVFNIIDNKDKSRGVTYLFYFECENLKCVFKSHWITD